MDGEDLLWMLGLGGMFLLGGLAGENKAKKLMNKMRKIENY